MINNKLIIIFILCLLLTGTISYIVGFKNGATYTAEKMIKIGGKLFNVELSPIAMDLLTNNPELMNLAIKNNQNYTNPFSNNSNAKIHFQLCMLKSNDYDGCYEAQIAKYGMGAIDK
jgi:basic membrane lipoprotein Med (substrate-binding protein (PBP1-ABC) superfamily)